MMKILMGCGGLMGFRGNSEYHSTHIHNIERGEFPPDHPWRGFDWYGITGFTDKTNKLSIHKSHARLSSNESMRVPIMGDGLKTNDWGGSLDRFLKKKSYWTDEVVLSPDDG